MLPCPAANPAAFSFLWAISEPASYSHALAATRQLATPGSFGSRLTQLPRTFQTLLGVRPTSCGRLGARPLFVHTLIAARQLSPQTPLLAADLASCQGPSKHSLRLGLRGNSLPTVFDALSLSCPWFLASCYICHACMLDFFSVLSLANPLLLHVDMYMQFVLAFPLTSPTTVSPLPVPLL